MSWSWAWLCALALGGLLWTINDGFFGAIFGKASIPILESQVKKAGLSTDHQSNGSSEDRVPFRFLVPMHDWYDWLSLSSYWLPGSWVPGVACLRTWTHVVVAMALPAQIWPPFRCSGLWSSHGHPKGPKRGIRGPQALCAKFPRVKFLVTDARPGRDMDRYRPLKMSTFSDLPRIGIEYDWMEWIVLVLAQVLSRANQHELTARSSVHCSRFAFLSLSFWMIGSEEDILWNARDEPL